MRLLDPISGTQEQLLAMVDDEKKTADLPIIPTAVSIPSMSGTTSSVLRCAQTSMTGLRTSGYCLTRIMARCTNFEEMIEKRKD